MHPTKLLLIVLVGACGNSKAAEPAAESAPTKPPAVAAAPVIPAASAKPAAPVQDPIPETDELKRTAESWLKDRMVNHAAKAAPGIKGARVPGGCTVKTVDKSVAVSCYSLKPEEVGYMQRMLLVADGWTIGAQTRGPKGAYWIEAEKAGKKLFVEASREEHMGTAVVGNLILMPH